jgi:hypothetical protein
MLNCCYSLILRLFLFGNVPGTCYGKKWYKQEKITNLSYMFPFLVFCKLYSYVDEIRRKKGKNSDFVQFYEEIRALVPFNRLTPLWYAFKKDKMQVSNIKCH